MTTEQKLKEIGAKEIKVTISDENLIGRISFSINGVKFSGQFDADNTGLYAVGLMSDLIELKKLNKN